MQVDQPFAACTNKHINDDLSLKENTSGIINCSSCGDHNRASGLTRSTMASSVSAGPFISPHNVLKPCQVTKDVRFDSDFSSISLQQGAQLHCTSNPFESSIAERVK